MEYLDLTIVKESRKTESALCAISGKIFGKEHVLTALVSKKPVAQPVGSINIDQKVGGKSFVEDKSKSLTYKIRRVVRKLRVITRHLRLVTLTKRRLV